VIELVIDSPHLQTHGQRFSALSLTLMGWMLWSYFFFPLITLSCWLVDNDICSQWVNFAGGYLSLREDLAICAQTVVGLALIWSLWMIYSLLKAQGRRPEKQPGPVSAKTMSVAFGVETAQLRKCRAGQYTVVRFDAHGHIVDLNQS
jgi:poly-beta-1,6-N-acetyl-D-glucosamine biosynthesis protein PgaD